MKIFISWSGERSKQVASALKGWLPDVFQGDDIFMSEHDIEAGARWGNRLNLELEESRFGIVCLSPENLTSPWLLFEAGALSKAIEDSHVVPYLLELKKIDVAGPLSQFQGVSSDEEGTFKLVQSINETREKPLTTEALKKGFNKWWNDLKQQLDTIAPTEKPVVHRQDRELLEEILQIIRSQNTSETVVRASEDSTIKFLTSSEVSQLKTGQRIGHMKFGIGVIKFFKSDNPSNPVAAIDFEQVGEKLIMLKFARIYLP